MKGTAIAFILAGVGALVATALVVMSTQPRLEEARASAAWPTVEGVLVDAWSTRRSGTHIRYRYAVQGRDYESDRIRFVNRFLGDTRSEVAARYPEGKHVALYYDPFRPERSVLEPGATAAAVAKKYVGAAIFALLAMGVIAVGVRGLAD